MGCGIAMVKYLLFIFNFVFVLLGAAVLGVGIYVLVSLGDYTQISSIISSPAIGFIVIGAIVFVIAFFGCCGAIKESHCMVVTYAVFLLTILIVQIALGIWAFVLGNDIQTPDTTSEITSAYQVFINNYWTNSADQAVVDTVQSQLSCCGINGYADFNGTVPWSCCGNPEGVNCTSNIYTIGCITPVMEVFEKAFNVIGGVAIGVAVVELVGIVFSLCLANSIKNDDRRGYRV